MDFTHRLRNGWKWYNQMTFEKALDLDLKREQSLGLGHSETLDYIGLNKMSVAKEVPVHHKKSHQKVSTTGGEREKIEGIQCSGFHIPIITRQLQ